MDESQDVTENSLQIKRTFQGNNLNKLGVTDIATEMSSLNSLTVVCKSKKTCLLGD